MSGENKIIIVVLPRTWRDIKVPIFQSLFILIVSNYIGWCLSVITFEENYNEYFWWRLGFTMITWFSLERVYKQSIFDSLPKDLKDSNAI